MKILGKSGLVGLLQYDKHLQKLKETSYLMKEYIVFPQEGEIGKDGAYPNYLFTMLLQVLDTTMRPGC